MAKEEFGDVNYVTSKVWICGSNSGHAAAMIYLLEFEGHGVRILEYAHVGGGNRGLAFPAFSRIGDSFVC